jgi:hypothetical protein
MSARFAVVHEADADFTTATELADRTLVHVIGDWLDDEQIAYQREWVAETSDGQRLRWSELKRLARDAGIRARGHFDGQPGLADAAAARRALLFALEKFPGIQAILLIRDQDDDPERRAGLEQARQQDRSRVAIVIGLAAVEREAWAIAGFDPESADESARLESERKHLGYDPRVNSHRLTACKDDTAVHSPKRVLKTLVEGDWERQRRCWTSTPIDRLRERGVQNGLANYLEEIRTRLAPIIGHVPET